MMINRLDVTIKAILARGPGLELPGSQAAVNTNGWKWIESRIKGDMNGHFREGF